MTKTTATVVTTRYSSHPTSGAGRITVKGPNGQRTFLYPHDAGSPSKAHAAAVNDYIVEAMGNPDLTPVEDETYRGKGARFTLVPIDYSNDEDERHPDDPTYVSLRPGRPERVVY